MLVVAIEDKLQEGVPNIISLFQKAGIKVRSATRCASCKQQSKRCCGVQIWVLTGDKLETSVEMGKLCRVVTPGMREVVLRASTREEMAQRIDAALREARVSVCVVGLCTCPRRHTD